MKILRVIAVDRYFLPLSLLIVFVYPWLALLPAFLLIFKYGFMLHKINWYGGKPNETRKFGIAEFKRTNGISIINIPEQASPYLFGLFQGHLLYPEIRSLIRRFKIIRPFIKLPTASVPSGIRSEIYGLVEAYNSHVGWFDRITYEQAIEYHSLVDSWIACSVIVHKLGEHTYVGRNMDFCPFGTGGSDSVLIYNGNRCYLTVPGFIGLISAWKQTPVGPLCCFLNISYARISLGHTPATLAARDYFDNISSVNDKRDIDSISACHLTLVSPVGYVQKNINCNDDHIITMTNTPIEFADMKYWTTFNYSFPKHFNNATSSNSRDRTNAVHNVMCVNPRNKMNALLAITSDILNVPDTIHSFYMDLSENLLYLSCDNGFAGDGPYYRLPIFQM